MAMYHAHHHGQMQVPNGLFGTFMVGEVAMPVGQTIRRRDPDRSPGCAGDPHGAQRRRSDRPQPQRQVVSGHPALHGEGGDWVVVHYYNEGLQIHPMHQHQFRQLVYAKDGIPLDNPYWIDTLNVAPGERYSVLMQLEDPASGFGTATSSLTWSGRGHVRDGDRHRRGEARSGRCFGGPNPASLSMIS